MDVEDMLPVYLWLVFAINFSLTALTGKFNPHF